jgi:hypothetical protein
VDFQDKKKSVFYGFILSATEKERKREKYYNSPMCLGFEVNYGEGNNDGAQVF